MGASLLKWNLSEDRKAAAPLDPQLLNRYSYSRNNPVTYYDPTGKLVWVVVGGAVGGLAGLGAYTYTHQDNFQWGEALVWAGGGALAGSGVVLVAGVVTASGAGAATVAAAEASGTVVAAAAGTARTGYGGLARAAEHGIKSYSQLSDKIAGTGLRAHHIIEKRFAGLLGKTEGEIRSVALTQEEHQAFTNAWRREIGYSNSVGDLRTDTASVQDLWRAAQRIYRDYPDLLQAAKQELGIQ